MEMQETMEMGDWVMEKFIGTGTFGAVLLWRNKIDHKCVAIKRCKQDIKDPKLLELWQKEVKLFQNLNHPGLIGAVSLPEALAALARDSPVICMEYCNSGDLRKYLNQPVNCCGLPEREVLDLCKDISAAIQYLHSCKIVHRDLKPENVVLHAENHKKTYKLIDFGFAKDLKMQNACQTFVGTMEYVAPELFSRNTYDSAVDYWSFGFIVHECITGFRPFSPGNPNWLPYAGNKTKDQICIYLRPDGSIEYSTKLMKENNLNGIHQVMFEEWLRSALDLDPDTRGRNPDSTITFFDKLETIVNTRIITVFWVDGLIPLHYDASDTVTMETIHEWIERDTGIPQSTQLIITSQGHRPDPKKSINHIFSPNEEFTVFLLNKDPGRTAAPQTDLPELVSSMFEDPRRQLEFRLQRRMWAQACFFLRKQENQLKKLSQGVKLFLGYATILDSRLKAAKGHLAAELRRLERTLQYFSQSLAVDKQKFQEQSNRGGLSSSTLLDKWNQEHRLLINQFRNLESRCSAMFQSSPDHLSKFNEHIKSWRDIMSQPLDWLASGIQSAHELYAQLLRKPKEERLDPSGDPSMTKVLIKAMKNYETHSRNYYGLLGHIGEYVAQFDSLLDNFELYQVEINRIDTSMIVLQGQRQTEIWVLLERAISFWQQTSQLTNRVSSIAGTPSLEHLSPQLAEMNGIIDTSLAESSSVIQENQALRYEIQSNLTSSLTNYCSLTKNSPDWSFLTKRE